MGIFFNEANSKTSLEEIIRFNQELNMYEYIIPNNGNPIIEIKREDFDNYYRMLSPQEFNKYKGGVCWDYVTYEAYYFKRNFPDIKFKSYYHIGVDTDGSTPTHTFIVFKYGNKFYWFESSWKPKRGVYEFNTEKDALNYIIYNLNKDAGSRITKSFLIEYNALDNKLYGMNGAEYMTYMEKRISNRNLFGKPKSNIEPNAIFNNDLPCVPEDSIYESSNINDFKRLNLDEKTIDIYKSKFKMLRHIRVNSNTKGYLYINSNNEFVGLINTEKKSDGIWIQALEVADNMKHKGIGTKLLQIAINDLKTIKLSVRKNNTPAINLYNKTGWKEYDQTDTMIFMSYGTINEEALSSKDRKGLSDKEFGLPKKRKYPLNDKEHVLQAIRFFNYCDEEDRKELANNIIKKIEYYFDKEEQLDIHVGEKNDFKRYWKGPKAIKESFDDKFPKDDSYYERLSSVRNIPNSGFDDSVVYFTSNISPESLLKIFKISNNGCISGRVGVKLSTGEAGNNNYLKPELIKLVVDEVNGIICECNTAYEGKRNTTQEHIKVIQDHGFLDIADVDIMDSDGQISLPVTGGNHLTENFVGETFQSYDSFLILSHFKGHAMGGFGGALKNISIGFASQVGKRLIHTAGRSKRTWKGGEQIPFLESMAEAAQSVCSAKEGRILFINVMNNMSVDCDCSSHPEEPTMKDIGILASLDPVALDQACVDLVYSAEDGKDVIERIETRNGTHILEYAHKLGIGSRRYKMINIDNENVNESTEDNNESRPKLFDNIERNVSNIKDAVSKGKDIAKNRLSIAKDRVKSNVENDPIKKKIDSKKNSKVKKEGVDHMGLFFSKAQERDILNGINENKYADPHTNTMSLDSKEGVLDTIKNFNIIKNDNIKFTSENIYDAINKFDISADEILRIADTNNSFRSYYLDQLKTCDNCTDEEDKSEYSSDYAHETGGFFFTKEEEYNILNEIEVKNNDPVADDANKDTNDGFGTDPDGSYTAGGSGGGGSSDGGSDEPMDEPTDDAGDEPMDEPTDDAGGDNESLDSDEGGDEPLDSDEGDAGDEPLDSDETGGDTSGEIPTGDGGGDTGGGDEPLDSDEENPDGGDDTEGEIPEDGEEGEEGSLSDEIKNIEKELFSDIDPEQMKEKKYRLKRDYMDLYETVLRLSDDINKVPRNSNTQTVLDFLSRKITELKELISYNMLHNFDNKTFIENTITYQECLAALNSINSILEELGAAFESDEENPETKTDKDEAPDE
jgi:hypothetical protein